MKGRNILIVGVIGLSTTTIANAQLTQNITMGNSKALGLGHAVTADPPGIDSIHFNPAGLAKIKGRQRQIKLIAAKMTFNTDIGKRRLENAQTSQSAGSVVDTYNNIYCNDNSQECLYPDDPLENQSGSSSTPVLMLPFVGMTELPLLFVPLGGIAIEDPDRDWVFATSIYSPQAIGYGRDEDGPGRYQGIALSITRITYFSPSVAFSVTDSLMFGLSLGFSWQGLGLDTDLRAPETTIPFLKATVEEVRPILDEIGLTDLSVFSPYDTLGRLEVEVEDALSITFNLGLLWEPTPWVSFGMVYQSEGNSHMEGDFKMEVPSSLTDVTQPIANTPRLNSIIATLGGGRMRGLSSQEGTVELDLKTPQHFAIGSSVKVFPDLKINVDLKWTDYGTWEDLAFTFDQNIDFLVLANLVNNVGGSAFNNGEDTADPDKMVISRRYESVWSWAFGAEYEA
ncbi:MAG: outer membrane protein transport protein [Pseudomonadales bacterium]|nr:outer membrane protein transport protein [Pseudomonadales bacterium]